MKPLSMAFAMIFIVACGSSEDEQTANSSDGAFRARASTSHGGVAGCIVFVSLEDLHAGSKPELVSKCYDGRASVEWQSPRELLVNGVCITDFDRLQSSKYRDVQIKHRSLEVNMFSPRGDFWVTAYITPGAEIRKDRLEVRLARVRAGQTEFDHRSVFECASGALSDVRWTEPRTLRVTGTCPKASIRRRMDSEAGVAIRYVWEKDSRGLP